ncbi:MAG TPA: c-type cytochrome [Anaerolineales bacterium]|nr:c-type cytochrome [Anaerolineales bacterium]
MNEESKKKIKERYQGALRKGERFWPDSIFKDLLVSLAIFILLVLLATFVGVASQPKADPTDTSYIPRPEWYFLFLFKFLAIYGQIPLLGKIEWIATVVIPGFAILVLTLLPFIDRSPNRYYGKRILPISVMAIIVVGIVMLTLMADIPTVSPDGSSFIGLLQAIAGLLVPGLAIVVLFALSFGLKNTHASTMLWTTGVSAVLMLVFTGIVLAMAPKTTNEEPVVATTLEEQIVAGQDLYSINCTECHGDDGKVTKIEGVKGLEGKEIPPINGTDVLYTLDDPSLAQVIAYGRPNAGMNPFGKAYNPDGLSKSDIDNVVTFMRYTWDNRFEAPPIKPLFPPLATGEVPSYDVHIQPIVKRYCLSCHRAGKENNNYLMDTYDNMLHTGDHKDKNIVAGDPNSYLLQVIQGTPIPDPKDPTKDLIRAMPPNGHLQANIIDAFQRWIMAGMPQTAAEAAQLKVQTTGTPAGGTPAPAGTPTP